MVILPKHRVREVHLRCRFCAHYHFNTWNKGIAFVPGKILSEGKTPSLPHTYRNILHDERPQYGRNLPVVTLLQLRQEAAEAAYEEGIVEPYHVFEKQSSGSISSVELESR